MAISSTSYKPGASGNPNGRPRKEMTLTAALEAIVDKESRDRGVPGFLTNVGKAIAGWRFNIHWGEVDYLSKADELSVPILLFHGEADGTVFVETSDALAEIRPDIVTYVRSVGVDHVRSWNAAPAAYEAAVREFAVRLIE